MGLLDDTRVKALLVGFLLSLFALVGVTALGLLAALSAVTSPAYADESLLFALLDATAPFLVGSLLLGGLSFLLLVGLTVTAVRRASMPRDDRLARLARVVEHHSSEARSVGLAKRFEPTTEDRIEDLKQEYVEGEITELEYERRLQDLMDDGDVSDERVRSERNRTERGFE